jgi:hypothetical protein
MAMIGDTERREVERLNELTPVLYRLCRAHAAGF